VEKEIRKKVEVDLLSFIAEIRRMWLYAGIVMTVLSFVSYSFIKTPWISILIAVILSCVGIIFTSKMEKQAINKYFLIPAQENEKDVQQ
jgi:hypothetical protein